MSRRDDMKKQLENKKKYEKETKGRKEWIEKVFINVLESGEKKTEKEEEDDGGDLIVFGGSDEKTTAEVEEEEKKDTDEATAAIADELADVKIDDKEVLPHLGTRVDPMTLLSRLNTRRLYGRLRHYRKLYEERDAERVRRELEKQGGGEEGEGGGVVEGGIMEMYDKELKDIATRERVYPKNLSIMQMAQKEWNDLIQMANYR